MTDSILLSVKEQLGLGADYSPFDAEIKTYINTVLSTLTQLGIGPVDGFYISAGTETWSDFMGSDKKLNQVQTYVYLRVKILFDPPATSFAITAIEKQIEEFGWRINVVREVALGPVIPPDPDPDDPDVYGAGPYGGGTYGI